VEVKEKAVEVIFPSWKILLSDFSGPRRDFRLFTLLDGDEGRVEFIGKGKLAGEKNLANDL